MLPPLRCYTLPSPPRPPFPLVGGNDNASLGGLPASADGGNRKQSGCVRADSRGGGGGGGGGGRADGWDPQVPLRRGRGARGGGAVPVGGAGIAHARTFSPDHSLFLSRSLSLSSPYLLICVGRRVRDSARGIRWAGIAHARTSSHTIPRPPPPPSVSCRSLSFLPLPASPPALGS